MSTIIVYDSETTGLHYGFKTKSPTDPSHPHLVQLSALVVDVDLNRVTQSMNLVVCPEGWEIPEEATRVHGITNEFASQWGLAEKHVLDTFLALWAGGESYPLERVAHNAEFDKNVLATAIARHHGDGELLSTWLSSRDYCTMQTAKPIVQARNKRGAIKYPTLMETHEHFFGETFDRQHTANADVVATYNIWRALQESFQ